ncbi:5-(carboxyamino)imidazole ribonucleotide synthase [Marinicellulosiphila megalodicopiae]|uniref:5-(carboxyamino)imidazole ribonucleotide synthase n=1 Tax=Marinicellulosiphila megalodicopiae TaxID=2724896 RepID=UPI003BB123B2
MKISVVGGGQLGQMMALSCIKLGVSFSFLDPSKDACAQLVGDLIQHDYDSQEGIDAVIACSDRVTFEFESVPAQTVAKIAKKLPVFPSAKALEVARDRLFEKTLFQKLGIQTAPFADILTQQDLDDAAKTIGLPAIIKTRTLGYDGKGQKVLKTESDVAGTFAELGGVPLLYEGFVDFDDELSCIAVRSESGECRFYPLVQNEHKQSMLHCSVVQNNHPLQALGEQYAKSVLDELDYVGVMTFEYFRKGDQLLANEVAPRVHNSGHWSIEGAVCDQFENHIRAVAGFPLGSTKTRDNVALFNVIGKACDEMALMSIEGAYLHMYHKSEKVARKIGHITLVEDDKDLFNQKMAQIEALLNNDLG